jgi:hypothetical protein
MVHILYKVPHINGPTLNLTENRVLDRMFRPKTEEVTEGYTKLYNEELHNLYASSNIIKVIKLRTMKWKGVKRVWKKDFGWKILMEETSWKNNAWTGG